MSVEETGNPKTHPKALGGIITLYQDEDRDTKNWYYRFKNPLRAKGYVRKSSKTTELAVAKTVAIDHYEELRVKAKMGLTEHKTTISSLVNKFTKELPRTSKAPAQALLTKYWIRYFGDTDLATMDDSALFDFILWRQDPKNYFHANTKDKRLQRDKDSHKKGIHSVAKATLQAELKYLRFYLRRGWETGRIARLPNTRINYENLPHVSDLQPNKRRGRFTDDQLKEIEQWRRTFMSSWTRTHKLESEGREPTDHRFLGHAANRFHRVSFYMYITLAINTGIRPQEMRKIRWRDIKTRTEDGETFTYIEIRREVAKRSRNSKGKARVAICNNMEEMYRKFKMYEVEWTLQFGRAPSWAHDPDESDLIFANPRHVEKSRIPAMTIKHGLERISKERNFVVHGNFVRDPLYPDGKAWKQNTLYSFRSAYITSQLKHGTTLYHLSIQVGSSPKSISTSYAVDESLDYWKYYTNHVRKLRAKSK